MLRDHYHLAKPGIVYGNALTMLAAFLYASKWQFSWSLLVISLVGTMLVVASACIFNNYFDRDLDAHMERTKNRALAAGRISGTWALTYGAIVGALGLTFLYSQQPLAAALALTAWVLYVFVYTPLKRRTPLATIAGSIPGAIPVLIGYAAATGMVDLPALLIFFTLLVWQMPHFYAIAMYRRAEYVAADIPTLAVLRSAPFVKGIILTYILVFAWESALLGIGEFAGVSYSVVMLVLSVSWLFAAIRPLGSDAGVAWARRVFFFSLIVLLGYCIILSLAPFLP
jgi:protoheme IX farnesyltransferase